MTLAALAAVAWGIAYAVDGRLTQVIPPATILFIHAIAMVIITTPFVTVPFSMTVATWGLLATSVIMTSFAGWAILISIRNDGAATASIIEVSYPMFVVLFGWILFGDVPGPRMIVGAMLTISGVAVIMTGR